jgi:hypothetical protein
MSLPVLRSQTTACAEFVPESTSIVQTAIVIGETETNAREGPLHFRCLRVPDQDFSNRGRADFRNPGLTFSQKLLVCFSWMKKLILLSLLFGTAAFFSSCATQDVIAKASGQPGPLDPPSQPPSKPNAAYYALVPLTVPFDLLTWPIQYFYLQGRDQSGPSGPPPQYQSDSQYLYTPSPQPYRPPVREQTGQTLY